MNGYKSTRIFPTPPQLAINAKEEECIHEFLGIVAAAVEKSPLFNNLKLVDVRNCISYRSLLFRSSNGGMFYSEGEEDALKFLQKECKNWTKGISLHPIHETQDYLEIKLQTPFHIPLSAKYSNFQYFILVGGSILFLLLLLPLLIRMFIV